MENKKIGLAKDHVSFSQIKKYVDCPRSYYLEYHDGKKQTESFALQFGSTQHAVCERINKSIISTAEFTGSKEAHFEEVEKYCDEEFKKYHFDAAAYGKLKENMKAYAIKTIAEKSLIYAAEYCFRFPLKNGYFVEGRVDRVDVPEPDALEIVDFKSGSLIPTNEELQRSLQHNIYALVTYREHPEIKKIFVATQSLDCTITENGEVKGGFKKKVQKDLISLDDVERFLEIICEKMDAETEWKANPDIAAHCQYCPEKCEAFKKLLTETVGTANLDDIFTVGTEYITVKNQLTALNKREDTLKEMLKIHFDTNLKKDLVVGAKLIYAENCTKKAEAAPRAGYDYTKIDVTNHFNAAAGIGKLKAAASKAKGKK